nr:SDR family NAD(P)-dependent oxidoreductase [uncultured Carboxylicivirga sp.]
MKRNTPVAVITGPTSGIGKAFAQKLALQGYNLLLIARHEEKLNDLKIRLEQEYSVEIEGVVADLSLENDIDKVEKVIASSKRIDILINNAGFGVGGYFVEVPMQRQMDMVNVHLNSTIRFSRAAIPVMAKQQVKGNIINVASFSVFIDVPGSVMYSTTKSAVVHFSKTLQYEVSDYDIKIQALCPVFTPTSFHESIHKELAFLKNIPDFFWTPVSDVVNSSLRSLKSRKVICIPGQFNRLIYWFNKRPVFSSLIHKITMRLNNRDHAPEIADIKTEKQEEIEVCHEVG